MSEPFVGELRLFPINYAPRGWAFCDGQILQINQNQALYSLLGTTYGGDGRTTFALPDLRGKVPVHVSTSIPYGTSAGEASHTLTINEIPQHTHQVVASSANATATNPAGNTWAQVAEPYAQANSLTQMNPAAIGTAGGSQAHNNMQPYLAMHFCIAVQGIYPSRN
ncbi:tail Collar domain-containing protein [Brevibacillus reuszeri]|uniref:Tail Collar domain-containing protein n=1 Tax=Brevibacillus reuszeri TaxID=54915 RepID=A0A0K9YXH6_9BACL|nr:tail fiber protein [Brevibacillus reuszeri]KNB73429.1 tail collar protein [Brevibacillus reuszeri]MED1857062.1 tail fiber protein [Brevibacillus reuszeri]GED68181.1 tail Collar domain-containing protein [Brevibacillus reuszeri]